MSLIVPITISVLVLGAYNVRRFGSVTETGYAYNVTLGTGPLAVNAEKGLAEYYFFMLPVKLNHNDGHFGAKRDVIKAGLELIHLLAGAFRGDGDGECFLAVENVHHCVHKIVVLAAVYRVSAQPPHDSAQDRSLK